MGESLVHLGLVSMVADSSQHVGRLQTAVAMRFYLYGEHAQKMNLRQRAVGLIYVLLSLCNLITTIGMVTLLISISSGLPLIAYKSEADFHTLLQLVCVSVMAEWLDDCIVALLTGYRIAISEGHCNYWIAPCKQHYQAHRQWFCLCIFRSRSSSRTSLLAQMAAKQDV